MTPVVWLAAASSAVFLALALLAATRRARHPLALHLGLMSIGLFAYGVTEVLSSITEQRFWVWLGDAAAALTAIPTLELFVGFLGGARTVLPARRFARVYFSLLGLLGLAPFVEPSFAILHDSGGWSLLMLAGLVPGFVLVLRMAVRRARRAEGRERERARMVAGALLVGVGSVVTDLLAMAGLDVPRLSYVGLLVASLLLAGLVLEARILSGVRVVTVVNAVFVAMLALVAQVVVVAWAGDRTGLVLFGTVLVVLVSAAALLPLVADIQERRARTEHLVTLGRFAQQMAHDVRNPLAAIKGAAQFLEQERAEGRSIDDQAEMLALIVERADRIERFVADYQRMGRVEPLLREVDAAAALDTALRAADNDASRGITIERKVAEGLSTLEADPDLLGFALENLIRNACEAMPKGGTLTVSAEPIDGAAPSVRLAVADTGAGMDVRTRERALGGFFTTKETGSGLGLAFVRRVVEAHGARLRVQSAEGRGTRVMIDMPARVHPSSEGTL